MTLYNYKVLLVINSDNVTHAVSVMCLAEKNNALSDETISTQVTKQNHHNTNNKPLSVFVLISRQ